LIVVDTSALIAILTDEPVGRRCRRVLEDSPDVRISAGTLAEALIVSGCRGFGEEMAGLIENLGIVVEPVGPAEGRQAAHAYLRWGKGFHPAHLNFGDCFAYVLARALDCPLLFVGSDFSHTDLASALG
jgi:ribonuclease VapC